MDVRVGPQRKLRAEELMLLNCGIGEDSLRVPWTARSSNQSILKEISPEYSLEYWSWNSKTLATWCGELTHLKRPWCWERLKAEGEGDDRGWDGWMASLTQWTWVWVSSRSWWWTGKPGMLQSMGSQRVGHGYVTEINWYFPGSASGKELTCQCRRCRRCEFNTWVRKIPWQRAWQPTPVFLSGKSHGLRSLAGCGP